MLIPPTPELRRQASRDEIERILKSGPPYQEPVSELILLVSHIKLSDVAARRQLFSRYFTLLPEGELDEEAEYDFIFPGRLRLGVTFQRLGLPLMRANSYVTLPVEMIDLDRSTLFPDQILITRDGEEPVLIPSFQPGAAPEALRQAAPGAYASVFTRFKGCARDVHIHDLYDHVNFGRWLDKSKLSMKALFL